MKAEQNRAIGVDNLTNLTEVVVLRTKPKLRATSATPMMVHVRHIGSAHREETD
jgi:hypothetical protein